MKSAKKGLWCFAIAVTILAVVASAFLWSDRMQSEANYRSVQMIVNYDDVAALANANGLSVEEAALEMKQRGVSAMLFKERSVEDLQRLGKAEVVLGKNVLQQSYAQKISTDLPLEDTDWYLCIFDEAIVEQTYAHLSQKINGVEYYPGEVACLRIPTMLPNSALEYNAALQRLQEVGVGFEQEKIAEIAALDFMIVPQIRSWEQPSGEALRFVFGEIKELPHLYAILFNDKEVVGAADENTLRAVAQLLTDENGEAIAPLGTIEFSDQKGLHTLGALLGKNVVRLHTISNSEMGEYANIDAAMDRWMLAARERNMRALFVRFFNIYTPQNAWAYNMEYLETLQQGLLEQGFTVGEPYHQLDSVGINTLLILLSGMGVAAGLMMLLLKIGLPKLSVVGFCAATVCWVGLFFLSPILARKLMALAGVIIYPTLACVSWMTAQKCNIPQALGRTLAMSAVSFLGAIFMVGLLADALFMMKLDGFVGVKIAHIIPILAVPFLLYLWQGGFLKNVKELLATAMTYQWVILGVVVAIAGVIYISRTGNTSGELSGLESAMRTALNDWLGVRPRSKEFLIGYPFTMLLFYLGASRKNWIFTLPAIIGQVSLVNTYAHIHTPLLISLERSFNGLALGLTLGVLLIITVKGVQWLWCKQMK